MCKVRRRTISWSADTFVCTTENRNMTVTRNSIPEESRDVNVLTLRNLIGRTWLLLLLLFLVTGVVPSAAVESCSSSAMDDCMRQISGFLLNSPSAKGIPASQQELNNMCQIFDDGMKCLDAFSASCLDTEQRKFYEQQVSGAREVMQHLCEDNSVRKEFLQHVDCFKRLNDGWEKCAAPLAEIVNNSIGNSSVQDTKMEAKKICRARQEFLTCIQVVTDNLCDASAAKMVQSFALTLVDNSKQHTNSQCPVPATWLTDTNATGGGERNHAAVGETHQSHQLKPAANAAPASTETAAALRSASVLIAICVAWCSFLMVR